jgi:hypothetical protein
MAAPCPTCGKDVDPLRAPAARVIGGKIVAYCSVACADQLPKAAAAVMLSPPRRATAAPSIPARAVSAPLAAVEPADEPSGGVEIAAPPRRRRLVLGITAGIVVGGMAVAIVQAVSPTTPQRVEASHPPADAGVPDAGAPRD